MKEFLKPFVRYVETAEKEEILFLKNIICTLLYIGFHIFNLSERVFKPIVGSVDTMQELEILFLKNNTLLYLSLYMYYVSYLQSE